VFIKEDDVQTLADLGLTPREARIFLALVKSGPMTAKTLTTVVKLPRQDAYKIMDELQRLGVVERHVCTPTKFAAIPLQEVCHILFNRRNQRTTDLQERMEIMARDYQEAAVTEVEDWDPNLSLVSEGEASMQRIEKSVEKAKESIDIISSKHALQGLFYLSETLQRALERGVQIRFLVGNPEPKVSQLEPFQALVENSSFKIRTVPNHTDARFSIYDKNTISIILLPKSDFSKCALLWTDCASLVETYQEYYELLWRAANPLGATSFFVK
jgi:HTH-type transcriptional regulator, sugar sensing transcriptional regulator